MKKSELETLISKKSQEIFTQMAKEIKENYIDNPDKSKSDELAYLQFFSFQVFNDCFFFF